MRHVLHLVRHDITTHHRLLLAWAVVVLAHPVVAALPWGMLTAATYPAAIVLIVGRLALGAVAIATVLQADSPLDDRTFWRTRPVAPGVMATAKLTIGALFVGLPLMVVLSVAMVVGVPASHMPSTAMQVVITDAAAVGLALFLSSWTRGIASMLVALLGSLFGCYVLVAAITETLRVTWVRQLYAAGPPSPDFAAPTMLLVCVVATWTMAATVFLGRRYRVRLLAVSALGILAVAIVWFVPAARLHQPARRLERQPSVSIDGGRIRAERLDSGRVALVGEGNVLGLQPGDRMRQYLIDGTVETDDGVIAARRSTDVRFLAREPRSHPLRGRVSVDDVLLGVLSGQDFRRLAGRPARFNGRINLEVARTDIIGALPLTAGATLDLGDIRLRLVELHPPVPPRSRLEALAAIDATWTASSTQGTRMPLTQWWLRRGRNRHFLNRFRDTPIKGLTLLPSLARPFGRERLVAYVFEAERSGIDEGGVIEIEEDRGPVYTQQTLRVEFLMPANAAPSDVVHDAQ